MKPLQLGIGKGLSFKLSHIVCYSILEALINMSDGDCYMLNFASQICQKRLRLTMQYFPNLGGIVGLALELGTLLP